MGTRSSHTISHLERPAHLRLQQLLALMIGIVMAAALPMCPAVASSSTPGADRLSVTHARPVTEHFANPGTIALHAGPIGNIAMEQSPTGDDEEPRLVLLEVFQRVAVVPGGTVPEPNERRHSLQAMSSRTLTGVITMPGTPPPR